MVREDEAQRLLPAIGRVAEGVATIRVGIGINTGMRPWRLGPRQAEHAQPAVLAQRLGAHGEKPRAKVEDEGSMKKRLRDKLDEIGRDTGIRQST